MDDIIYKSFIPEVKGADPETGIVDMLIPMSLGTVDRDNEVIDPKGWQLTNFRKRPIMLSSHSYGDLRKQIGRYVQIKRTDDGLYAKPQYFVGAGNPEADWAFQLASWGVAAFSVGFIPLKWEDGDPDKGPRRIFRQQELLEISHVVVPAHPGAIQSAIGQGAADPVLMKALEATLERVGDESDDAADDIQMLDAPGKGLAEELEEKGAISYASAHAGGTSKAPEDTPWDAGREVRLAEVSDLKVMCTWVGDDSDLKTSYKLPHHKAQGHACVWKAVAACAAAIMGGRGGVDIPEGDMATVKAHIAKHYKEFDKGDPPWAKGPTQQLVMDELDYVNDLLEQVGVGDHAEPMCWELVRTILRLTGSDMPDDIAQVLVSQKKAAGPRVEALLPRFGKLVREEVQREISRLQGKV